MKKNRGVNEPSFQPLVKAPRIKAPKYVIKTGENFNLAHTIMSITNGLPIKMVQPELYDLILPYVKMKRDRVISEGNIYAVKVLNKALTDMDDYYQKEQEKQEKKLMREQEREAYELRKAKEEEERRKKQHQFTKEEIDESIDLALSGRFDQIDPRIFKQLTAQLRKLHNIALKKDDIALASKYDATSRKILSIENENKFGELANAKVQECDKKVSEMKEDLRRLQQDWRERIEEERRIRDEEIEEMQNEAKYQLNQFDQQFSGELPSQYKKYSSAYLSLRQKERILLNAKRFEEAEEMKRYADSVQVQEDKELRTRFDATLEMRRQEFLRKLQEKLDVYSENSEVRIMKMEREATREIDQLKKSIKRHEIHQQEAEQMASIVGYSDSRPQTGKEKISQSESAPSSARINKLDLSSANENNNNNSNWRSRQNRNLNSARDRDSQRAQWIRDLKTPRQFQEEKNSRDLFRQRRTINYLMYSKANQPQVRKVSRKEY